MYQASHLPDENSFIDFHVALKTPNLTRKLIKPQVQFYFDGIPPFKPLPYVQAYPMLEWGLNLCISSNAHQFLIIHAAVVEKNDTALILPGPSGSGKSTLCATLINSGWRLLSDELTLISRTSGLVQPLVRPVSLKNQSINIIQERFPEALLTPVTKDTAKGTIAHMRPLAGSVQRSDTPAKARLIIFPQYIANSPTDVSELSRAMTFMRLIDNSFNYSLLGEEGFRLMSSALSPCRCFEFRYSNLDDALNVIDNLAGQYGNG